MSRDQSQALETLRRSYGGSEPSQPSFLRPHYVRYNGVNRSRDLGTTEILLTELEGQVGGQAGSHTLYFRLTLPRDLALQVVRTSTGASTDRFVRVGLLDGAHDPVPLDGRGYGLNADSQSVTPMGGAPRLAAGTYTVTVASDQWQALPYALTIAVGSYALLAGPLTGLLLASGRLPLVKPRGAADGTAPLSATALRPLAVKNLSTSSGATGQSTLDPQLSLSIPRGVALGQLDLSGRLKQTWRLTGAAQGSATAFGTLSSQQQGGGYGY
jgi:hypothetical protein